MITVDVPGKEKIPSVGNEKFFFKFKKKFKTAERFVLLLCAHHTGQAPARSRKSTESKPSWVRPLAV